MLGFNCNIGLFTFQIEGVEGVARGRCGGSEAGLHYPTSDIFTTFGLVVLLSGGEEFIKGEDGMEGGDGWACCMCVSMYAHVVLGWGVLCALVQWSETI